MVYSTRHQELLFFPVGAILAGLPFSFLAKQFDWKGAFVVLEALSIGVIIMKVATRNLEYKVVLIKKKMQWKVSKVSLIVSGVASYLIRCNVIKYFSTKMIVLLLLISFDCLLSHLPFNFIFNACIVAIHGCF